MEFCDGCETECALTNNGMCDTCWICKCSAGGKMCYRCSSEYDHLHRNSRIQELMDIIEEIETRLRKGGMTKRQTDDWIWILQNRRGDLAHERKK